MRAAQKHQSLVKPPEALRATKGWQIQVDGMRAQGDSLGGVEGRVSIVATCRAPGMSTQGDARSAAGWRVQEGGPTRVGGRRRGGSGEGRSGGKPIG